MFLNIGFLLHYFVAVRVIEGYTVLHLNLDEANDNSNSDIRSQTKDDTENLINKELLDEIINIVQKQKDGLTNIAIHNCLREQRTKLNKLRCIKRLVDKNKRTARFWYQSDLYDLFNDNSKDFETTTQANFIDLTRSSEDQNYRAFDQLSKFADDYVDFSGLARSGGKQNAKVSKTMFYKPGYRQHKHDLNGRRNENEAFILKKILRSADDSDSDSEGSDSVDLSRKEKKSKRYHKYSENSNSIESEEVRYKPNKFVKKDPFRYMQAPTRIYEVDLDRRRRLPHFLPKRHHWDEEDFKSLRNYWIHGPQGKYPGAYRIPY